MLPPTRARLRQQSRKQAEYPAQLVVVQVNEPRDADRRVELPKAVRVARASIPPLLRGFVIEIPGRFYG